MKRNIVIQSDLIEGTGINLPGTSAGLTDAQLRAADVKVTLNGEQVAISNFPEVQPVLVGNFPSTQPVTGNFYPATQPVSIAAVVPVSATDLDIRNLTFAADKVDASGSTIAISNFPATQPVSGVFFQATQPVSIAATVPVSLQSVPSHPVTLEAGTALIGNLRELRAATNAVTATGAAAAAVTLTLPAAGAGLFHYITAVEVRLYSSAARTGNATPITVTTTNIPGTPALTFETAGAIGTTVAQQPFIMAVPLKTNAANTATTIVAPAVTGGIWRITVTYFIG